MKRQVKFSLKAVAFFAALLIAFACEKEESNDKGVYENITITEATHWGLETQRVTVKGRVVVSGTTLTIEPGTIIRMEAGARIEVREQNGAIIANGTPEKGIVFTSAASNPKAGDWDYILFNEGATDCELEYCHIEFGGGNSSYAMVEVAKNSLVSINNSTLGYSQNYTIRAMDGNGFQSFHNNTVYNDYTHPLWVSVENITSIGEGNEFITTENTGIYVREGSNLNRVTTDVVWQAQNVPYFFERGVEVRGNATLTLDPGVELRFANDRGLEVGVNSEDGKLIAVGTPDQPIIFRSAAHSPQPGNWRGLRFLANTLPGTIMEHCVVMHGGSYSLYQGNVTVEPCGAGNPIIKNSEFSESSAYGIFRRKLSNQWGDPLLENNMFFNNASGDVNEID